MGHARGAKGLTWRTGTMGLKGGSRAAPQLLSLKPATVPRWLVALHLTLLYRDPPSPKLDLQAQSHLCRWQVEPNPSPGAGDLEHGGPVPLPAAPHC